MRLALGFCFRPLSKEEKNAYDPTPELREAEEILHLEDLNRPWFSIASGPAKTKESVYFASPSARPFVEYEYNRMRSVLYDHRNLFYRWNLFLHARASFFSDDVNGPIYPAPSPASLPVHIRDTPVAVMRKVIRRLVENVTSQPTGRTFSEKTIEEFLVERGFGLEFASDWDLTRLKSAYETRSHPLCREVVKAVEDGDIRIVRFE
ncbi:hypothetical protein V1522DRAFT_395694 [Lipomyces starkeyi]